MASSRHRRGLADFADKVVGALTRSCLGGWQAYPPSVANFPLPDITGNAPWLEVSGAGIVVRERLR
jgi:hypothetical protein